MTPDTTDLRQSRPYEEFSSDSSYSSEEGAVEVSEDKTHPPGDKDQVCIIRLLYWQTIKDVK